MIAQAIFFANLVRWYFRGSGDQNREEADCLRPRRIPSLVANERITRRLCMSREYLLLGMSITRDGDLRHRVPIGRCRSISNPESRSGHISATRIHRCKAPSAEYVANSAPTTEKYMAQNFLIAAHA